MDELLKAIYLVTEEEWHQAEGRATCLEVGPQGCICTRIRHRDGWHAANGATTTLEVWIDHE